MKSVVRIFLLYFACVFVKQRSKGINEEYPVLIRELYSRKKDLACLQSNDVYDIILYVDFNDRRVLRNEKKE